MPASDSKWTNALSESSHLIPDGNTRKWLTSSTAGREVILSTMAWVASQGFFFFPYVMDVQLGCWKLGQHFYVRGRRLEWGRTQHLSVLYCFAFSLAMCHPRGFIWGAISIWSIMEFSGEGQVLARHLSRSMEEKKQAICVLGQHSDSNPEGQNLSNKGHISLACTLHPSKTRAAGLN